VGGLFWGSRFLEQNYRSTQAILDAAQSVVREIRQRKEKHLWTIKQGGALLSLHVAADDIEEARAVARTIKQLKEQRTVTHWREIAVLYRMNAQSRPLEQQLRLALIPYVVIGSHSFWERKEIKDVLAYVRVVANPADDVALERILNVPNRGLGQQTIGRLRSFADEHKLSLSQTISDHLAQIPKLTARAKTSLLAFQHLLAELVKESRRLPLPAFLDCILEKTGYRQELVATSTEDIDRAANVSELRRVAEEFVGDDLAASLHAFLEHVTLIGSADTVQTGENGKLVKKQQPDCVHLITLHASKGLEFPVICIVGCDEGALPHSRASFDQAQMEEERRLAYVGFTRAMDHLLLFRAERRYIFGEVRDMDASRFLDDIPPTLITSASWGVDDARGGVIFSTRREARD
jgi:DNA helicase-2/ATP-dependent DNA helicase PcrA